MSMMKRVAGLAALVLGYTAVLHAQTPAPTAEAAAAFRKKYEAELSAAIEQKFAPQSLDVSAQLAKRATAALADKSYGEAMRLYREARWQLPYRPSELPENVIRVFGNTRMRHGDGVNQIVFSPDGTLLASAGNDAVVKIWDLGNGREVRTFREHKDKVRALAWSSEGKWIASTAGNDILLWSPGSGKVDKTLKGHNAPVNSVSFRDDGNTLVSGGDDGAVRIWDVAKGSLIDTLSAAPPNNKKTAPVIYQVAYSPNGKLIAGVDGDGNLYVWRPDMPPPQSKVVLSTNAHPGGAYQVVFSPDMKALYTCGGGGIGVSAARQFGGTDPDGHAIQGTAIAQKRFDQSSGGHSESVTALALSPDGKSLVTGSRDRSIRVWDVRTAKVVRTLQGHTDEITSLAFSKDGSQLASASKDQSIRVWSLSSVDEHRSFAGHSGYVWSVAFSEDGKLFASAGADRTILIRDATSGQILQTIPAHRLAVTALAFNHDGSQLVSCGGDQLVKIWNVADGKLIKELTGHTAAVMAVAFARDGKSVISGGIDKAARIWDVETGKTLLTFPDVRSPVSAVALRGDGKQAIVGCADGSVHVYDLSDSIPKESGYLTAHLSGVGSVAYSPDGSRLATCGGDRLVKIWRLPNGGGAPTLMSELRGHTAAVSSVGFSRDGRLLASGGGDQLVKVWDWQNGTELRSLRGHGDWISSVAFGADIRYVISGSVDRTVRVWELSNEETTPPIGHSRKLNTVAISADGRYMASGSDDHTIKVWDLASGRELYTLAEHTDAVRAIAFDPSGDRLVSGGSDQKLRVWDLKTQKVVHTIECPGEIAVIFFNARGDKFLVWYLRPGAGQQASSSIQVFDRDGKSLHLLTEREKLIGCLAFTTDGEWVALGDKDGSVRIWDIAKNERAIAGDMPVHQQAVADLVFSPDKKRLITGDEEGEIKIWDLAKKEAVKSFKSHTRNLLGIAMNPDGKRFVTVGQQGELRLWNAATGEKIKGWDLATPIRNLAFSGDGKYLITANGDTTLYVFELP